MALGRGRGRGRVRLYDAEAMILDDLGEPMSPGSDDDTVINLIPEVMDSI